MDTGSSSLSLSLSLSLPFPFLHPQSTQSSFFVITYGVRSNMNNDTQTIFSEFSDPYRRSLIDRICVALGNDNIPRVKALGLWFADIKALEVLVGHEQNPDILQSFLVDFSQYNLPRICAYSRGLPRPCIIELISFIQSGASNEQAPRPKRGDRGRSSSPAQASTAARLRSESRIPVPQGRPRPDSRHARVPVSLSGVFIIEHC